jgi:hypothetical protein
MSRLVTAFGLVLGFAAAAFASDDPPLEPIGRWPNGFAFSIVTDPEGKTAYVGSGGTILVCDVSGPPAERRPLAEVATEGFVFSLAVEDSLLYVAGSRRGVFAIDVLDPRRPGAPVTVGAARDVAYDVAVRGDLIAAADGTAGVAFFRRLERDRFEELSRLELPRGRALGIALGDGFALVAGGDGDVLRVDLADPRAPKITATVPSTGVARSIAVLPGDRFALVAEDGGDLTLRDADTLEVKRRKRFVLPAVANPGPQRAPKPAIPLCAARVRISRGRAYVGLEGTAMAAQISPFTPEFGAWRGEPHYEPRGALAVVLLAPGADGLPSLDAIGFGDSSRDRNYLCWIKDLVALPNGDVLAVDFVTGVFRFRHGERVREDGLPAMIEMLREIDTRAGAMDVAPSPHDPTLLYVLSDIGGLQIFNVLNPAEPRLVARVASSGGTFFAVSPRKELDEQGRERPVDYVFINNFFRVGIVRIDVRQPESARALSPLWVTLPVAVRGKREFEALGLTPRSYRVSIEGDHLDVVATNTAFGWQRFSIPDVLAHERLANIHEGIARPPEYGRDCEPLFRAVTSPDHLASSERLLAAPFARVGKVMGILETGDEVMLGSGAQRLPADGGRGGRGGRGGGEPHDGYLQYFDLRDAIVNDPKLGPLRFPRATRFVPEGEVQITMARRGNELFVADSVGVVRHFDLDFAAKDPGPHGENLILPTGAAFENLGRFGRDSVFDVILEDDVLHVAGWSNGYLRLDARRDSGSFLTQIAAFDTPGLPISLARGRDGAIYVAEHNAGFLVFPALR